MSKHSATSSSLGKIILHPEIFQHFFILCHDLLNISSEGKTVTFFLSVYIAIYVPMCVKMKNMC